MMLSLTLLSVTDFLRARMSTHKSGFDHYTTWVFGLADASVISIKDAELNFPFSFVVTR